MKTTELMESLTQRFIRSIEDGLIEGKWTKPWSGSDQMLHLPVNVTTKKQYNGGNLFHLMLTGMDRGYDNGHWGTYKQWQSLDAQVKKGEKGSWGIKWVVKQCKHDKDEMCSSCGKMFPSVFTVFNACQVDGYEYEKPVVEKFTNQDQRSEVIDQFFQSLGGEVLVGYPNACYVPMIDSIRMPHFEDFKDAGYYYGTLAHEYVHWTGHTSRLDRKELTERTAENYASEELVAELGATVLCTILGIEEHPREDHFQYLNHWLTTLKGDNSAIFKAASKATKAVEYLTTNSSLADREFVGSL